MIVTMLEFVGINMENMIRVIVATAPMIRISATEGSPEDGGGILVLLFTYTVPYVGVIC